HKIRSMVKGKALRVETLAACRVHWTSDNWQTSKDEPSRNVGLGLFVADLPTEHLSGDTGITFTFYWPDADRWEGTDFTVRIESPQGSVPRARGHRGAT
ncbi:MAG TPA: hypothetical protein VII09_11190, partial [Opitutaceae bacterium]